MNILQTQRFSDRTSVRRGSALLPVVMMTGAAFAGGVGDHPFDEGTLVTAYGTQTAAKVSQIWLPIHAGTGAIARYDYRSLMTGTSLTSFLVVGDLEPYVTPTRMARIRALAALSLRDWAPVFGVSHAAIKQWADGEEPAERPKLDRVLNALSEASTRHRDLGTWLATPVPGTAVRPLDLLRDERWRAFRGAIRARSAPPAPIAPDELMRRRRAQASWVVAEPAISTEA